jgi:hypothetical protein
VKDSPRKSTTTDYNASVSEKFSGAKNALAAFMNQEPSEESSYSKEGGSKDDLDFDDEQSDSEPFGNL